MHLRNGEHFPTITASRVGGGELTIPGDLAGRWAVLLFYRGHWCPYCRQQLLDFQRAKEQLNELGAEVVALSVDSLEQAQQTVERHRLVFPVLYGLDARAVAKLIGASMNEDPGQSQLIFGTGSTGCVTPSRLSKLCRANAL